MFFSGLAGSYTHVRRIPVSLVILLALLSSPAAAQFLYGSLTGNVTDSSGAAVPGAKIEISHLQTGNLKTAVSDDRGAYLFTDLQPGTYKLNISAPAFQTVIQNGIVVEANAVRRADVTLQLASLTQSVTVDASAEVLQTDRADVNAQLGGSEVADLPLGPNRNFQSLYKIVPGFSLPAPSHSIAGNPAEALATNVNGISQNNNNTRLDGASDNNPWLPEIVIYVPPADGIESVNIVTNSFDAEQGMAGGSAINITTKSGTNQYHGSAWEYNTNSDLKARNYFYYAPNNPKNILNQFGITAGGPIKRNKLFFFVDWERTEQRQNLSGFQTVPTGALRQGDFAGTGATIYDFTTGSSNGTHRQPFPNNQIPASRISYAAAQMTSLLPEPNQSGVANDYFASTGLQFGRDEADIKINYTPTQNVSLFGRYTISPFTVFDPPALGKAGGNTLDSGGLPGNASGTNQLGVIGATATLTPNLLLDGYISFTRQTASGENFDINQNYGLDVLNIPGTNGSSRIQGGYPNFAISGFSSIGNPNPSEPYTANRDQGNTAANATWIKGAHSLRAGFEFTRLWIIDLQPGISFGARGGFNFTGGLSALNGGAAPNLYNGWADFLLGTPTSMGKDYQYTTPGIMENEYGWYVRDQWQVTRRLTLNLGLRWEFFPYETSKTFGGDRYDPSTNLVYLGGIGNVPYDTGINVGSGQWEPRFGVAYRLNERTVLRGGYGISANPNSFRAIKQSYPAIISTSQVGANSYTAAGSLTTGLPPFTGPDLSSGAIMLPAGTGTTTFPKDFRRGYVESFNMTVQRELGSGFNVEAGYVGTIAIRQTSQLNLNADGPGAGASGLPLYILYKNTASITQVTPFGTSTYNSLQTKMTHRFKSGMQAGIVYTYSKAIDFADNDNSGLMWNWGPVLDRNKAIAGFDRTHNFEAFGSFELPFGRGHNWLQHGVASAVASGWQVNSILSAMSGVPFSVASSATSLNAPGNSQTADQVLANAAILGGHGPNQPYFDPNAFAPVTAVRFGTSGRDILRGPGLFNLDLSIYRTFALREWLKLQFRAESFGLTNTPQFSNPSATVSNAVFNSNGTIKSLNGYDQITSSSGERQIRFGLKLTF